MRRFFVRLAISIALVLIAVVAALIAVAYFVFALYLWLTDYLVPPAAAVVSGLIVLVVAIVLAMISGGMLRRSNRRGPDSPTMNAAEAAAKIGSLFSDRLQGFAQMNRGTSLLTALVAGFAVGLSPKLRALLWRILKKMT